LSAERKACSVRILVTITPRMYREFIALSIHRRSPDYEVLLAPPELLDGEAGEEAGRFGPHVLVQDVEEAGALLGLPDSVLCRIRLLKTDRIDAIIELDGTTSEVRDASLEDLFLALEGAEMLLSGNGRG
jgi:hypothetical protein